MKKESLFSVFLFRLLLLLLFLPILQSFFGFRTRIGLFSYPEPIKDPKWSLNGWVTTDYQQEKGAYAKRNCGFNEDLVRFRNDWVFSLYKESNNNQVVVGKNNYLYERHYIKEYYGYDSIDTKVLKRKVTMLKDIQDKFKLLGKSFLLVIAPSKPYYYKEYIPERFVRKDSSTYDKYLTEIKRQGVQIFDVNRWFVQLKNTTEYPLFPQTGTHWSHYGLMIFGDSLLNYMENALQKDLPEAICDSIEYSSQLVSTDRDIERLLNLNFEIPVEPHAFPKIKYIEQNKYKPSVLGIGDSFYELFYCSTLPPNCFSSSNYWRYYSTVYPEKRKRKDTDIKIIKNQDVILLMSTTVNLGNLGWGAIEDLYAYVNTTKEERLQQQIKKMKEKIMNSPEWLKSIKEKAEEHGMALDSMIYFDAVYMAKKHQ